MGIYHYEPDEQASASIQARVNPCPHSFVRRACMGKFPSAARLISGAKRNLTGIECSIFFSDRPDNGQRRVGNVS